MREVINRKNVLKIKHVKTIILLLAPFVPHISQELWSILAKGSVHKQKWPIYDKKLIKESKVLIIIQVNGKVRGKMEVESFLTKEEIEKLALENEKVVKWLEGKKIKKVIFVPGRLINIVV
jgi:leucyl-tRNA synthetase